MVCRIKNRHTFKSMTILNSAYFTECRFVIRHITQTDTETETEANFTHSVRSEFIFVYFMQKQNGGNVRNFSFSEEIVPENLILHSFGIYL